MARHSWIEMWIKLHCGQGPIKLLLALQGIKIAIIRTFEIDNIILKVHVQAVLGDAHSIDRMCPSQKA